MADCGVVEIAWSAGRCQCVCWSAGRCQCVCWSAGRCQCVCWSAHLQLESEIAMNSLCLLACRIEEFIINVYYNAAAAAAAAILTLHQETLLQMRVSGCYGYWSPQCILS